MTEAATKIADQVRLRRRLPPPHMRRAIRLAAGLSAAEVAAAMGVTRQAVAAWERGRRTPRGPLLSAYIEVLEAMTDSNGDAS